MEERLSPRRPAGISRNTLRLFGLLLAALGILGRGILQNRVLGMASGTDLAALLESSAQAMNAATAAIILWVIEGTAVPIFTYLTVDGFQRTSSVKRYLLRLLLLAAAGLSGCRRGNYGEGRRRGDGLPGMAGAEGDPAAIRRYLISH